MAYTVEILPGRVAIQAEPRANLLSVLRDAQLAPEAPCGGHGTCKKCTVTVREGAAGLSNGNQRGYDGIPSLFEQSPYSGNGH